jgi:predicted metal-binding protein
MTCDGLCGGGGFRRRDFLCRSVAGLTSMGILGLSTGIVSASAQDDAFARLKPGTQSKKIGLIICGRNQLCGAGKCLRSIRERVGAYRRYPKDMPLELVGFGQCGGCPGGNVENVPDEMIRNGAEVIHLATDLIVGYPPCPNARYFKQYIESRYAIAAVIGSHPVPMKYYEQHKKLPSFKEMMEMAPDMMNEDPKIMLAYNT